jgi:divalent metal cation (Fe/Co/Zn/Cd) transporter
VTPTRERRQATRRTVIVAGAANLFVGVIKLATGLLAGSSAMLAEAAHSAADTLDQAFALGHESAGDPLIAYIVLAVAGLALR